MGSNSSKGKKYQDTSKYGEIYLKTDKTSYYPGETVTGHIHLNLIIEYPGNHLFVKFKGKEIVHIVRLEPRGNHAEYIKYSDKNNITKKNMLAHKWETLPIGQYTIPFSFMLPHHLPASFYQQGNKYLAFLEYQLEAFIQPNNNTDPKIKYKQPIVLKETIAQPREELPTQVITPLKTCWCCKRGSNTLKVHFEKNYYAPGDTAKVIMKLDNNNTALKNQEVILALKQTLKLIAKGKMISKVITKTQQELSGTFSDNSLSIVLPRFPLPEDYNQQIDKLKPTKSELKNLKENNNVITSTTRSSLIISEFFLEVSCPMSGCCSNTPKAQCPIGIYYPDIDLPVVNPPNDWHPLTIEGVNLMLPSDQNEVDEPLLKNIQEGGGQHMVQTQMIKVQDNNNPNHMMLEIQKQ